ncbi:hypothetical protein [Streptomyces sp. NPDC021020]|uniref:hypothetical protein n=1 Tax=Streptomyces sp. NPDC021020 TaxID=3365109 RepID=UPI00379A21BC
MSGPTVGLWLPQERSAFDAVPWLEGFCALVDFGSLLGYRRTARDLTREEEAARLAESRALVAHLPHPDFRLIT